MWSSDIINRSDRGNVSLRRWLSGEIILGGAGETAINTKTGVAILDLAMTSPALGRIWAAMRQPDDIGSSGDRRSSCYMICPLRNAERSAHRSPFLPCRDRS